MLGSRVCSVARNGAGRRGLATAAAAGRMGESAMTIRIKKPQPDEAPRAEARVSEVGGLTVATVDAKGPRSSVSVVLRAGPRFEAADAPGASAVYKTAVLRSVAGRTALRTVREAELLGTGVYTTLTREHVAVSSDFLRDALSDMVPPLLQHALSSSYSEYEFAALVAKAGEASARAAACSETRIVDALHQAAFGYRGLGHSTLPTAADLASLKRRHVRGHLEAAVRSGVAVVGVGVKHEDLEKIVAASLKTVDAASSVLPGAAAAPSSPASKYVGGNEVHLGGSAGCATVGLAFGAPMHPGSKELAAALVLKELLSRGAPVPFGSENGATTLLGPAAAASHVATRAFVSAHSDAGLFGVTLRGPAAHMHSVAQHVIAALKQVAEQDAKATSDAAVAGARAAAIIASEAGPAAAEPGRTVAARGHPHRVRMALQLAAGKGATPLAQQLGAVTARDLAALAKHLVKAHPTLATLGNTRELFQLDQLKL